MKAVKGLKPEILWKRFAELSAIPRNSKNEDKAREFIISQAEKNGLEHKTDSAGNVVVYMPSAARTDLPAVILQAHLDMVCEKDSGKDHDFTRHPITLVRDGEWIRADGTTLGADNGIAIAAMLALMEEKNLAHPPLELFFTIDEETGLNGAFNMDSSILKGRTLINLDSEEEDILYVGCAGGKETNLVININRDSDDAVSKTVALHVSGLKGGHSGTDIHEGRGNAIKLLVRLLLSLDAKFRLMSIKGGNLHNSIPREAEAVISIQSDGFMDLETKIKLFKEVLESELTDLDEGLEFCVNETKENNKPFTRKDSVRILDVLNAIHHGIIHVDMAHGATVTSTNLGVCLTDADMVRISTMQRSIINSAMENASSCVASIGKLAGAEVMYGNQFAGWKPDFKSSVLEVCKKCFKDLTGGDPQVKVIHAGLECGVIAEKLPGIETISFGPTIEHAHSPSERVNIKSAERFWDYLKDVLNKLTI